MIYVYVLTSKTFGSVVGAYSDLLIATSIAKTNNCTIDKVRIDGLYPGYLESVKQIWGEKAAEEVEAQTYADPHVVDRIKH